MARRIRFEYVGLHPDNRAGTPAPGTPSVLDLATPSYWGGFIADVIETSNLDAMEEVLARIPPDFIAALREMRTIERHEITLDTDSDMESTLASETESDLENMPPLMGRDEAPLQEIIRNDDATLREWQMARSQEARGVFTVFPNDLQVHRSPFTQPADIPLEVIQWLREHQPAVWNNDDVLVWTSGTWHRQFPPRAELTFMDGEERLRMCWVALLLELGAGRRMRPQPTTEELWRFFEEAADREW